MKTDVIGIGTDIIEIERVKSKISKEFGFREKIFTQQEIKYCESKADKFLNYAARFAAKEAFMKAMGTGWKSPLMFDEIEVVNDKSGKPEMNLYCNTKKFAEELGVRSIFISISHVKDIVNAVVLIQTEDDKDSINIHSAFVDISRILLKGT